MPPGFREHLGCWQKAQGPARWSRPEGLHLTLAFLGERPPEALIRLEGLGATVASRHGAFELRTAELGGFPRAEAARVLWLGLEPSRALEALAADLRGSLEAAGEAFDGKPFRPHLSLARFRQARPLGAFSAPPPLAFPAEHLVLLESRAMGGFLPLKTWRLGPPNP